MYYVLYNNLFLMKNKNSVIFIFLFYMVILSPYISSWFPTLNGMPLGPIIRQLFFVLIFIIFIINIRKAIDVDVKKICHIYLFVCLLTFVSFLYGPSSPVQYAVGVASFIFYPAIFIFSLLLLNIVSKKNYLIFDKFFTNFFIVIGLFASLDVAMNGGLVEVFGYNPNYGGDDFSLITSYNGVTRANAGISDALAFGYLMAIAVIYFFNRSRRIYSVANYIGLFVCTMAGMLSLTRGAMISIFMTYIFYMFTFRRLLILLLIFPVIFSASISGDERATIVSA